MTPASYFERDGDLVVPTELCGGPWGDSLMHGSAVGALLADAATRDAPEGFGLARITVDLPRPVPIAPLGVSVRTVRDGRRLKLIDVSLDADGREVSRASVQLLAQTEAPVDIGSTMPPPAPPPDECDRMDSSRSGRFNASCESRWISKPGEPGEGRLFGGWRRFSMPLFPGEPMAGPALVAAIADGGFGAGVVTTAGLAHINSDYTVYVVRPPRGEWLAVDGSLRLCEGGIAIGSAWLFDEDGAFGTATAVGLAQERAVGTQRS